MKSESARSRHPKMALPITATRPRSAAAEAYRTLRTNLQFATLAEPYRSLVFTSATAGEGKTTTASNFSIATAQSGTRVCLVDADLRRPSLHKMFDLPNKSGLSAALTWGESIASLAQPTHVPNLFVVPSGTPPPNPAELVASARMRELIAEAQDLFDLVVLDTPPIISVADPVAISAQCEGVIVVVRASTVPLEVIRRAISQIAAVQARIIGIVLNRVNLRQEGYYYKYYHYYQSYYHPGAKS
jgi:capsular exopolysaccharide synthesis family protein